MRIYEAALGLVAVAPQMRTDEIDLSLRAPSSTNPVLVVPSLCHPSVRLRQRQIQAALIELFHDDLSFERPFFNPSNSSSLAFRSSSGSGGLFGA